MSPAEIRAVMGEAADILEEARIARNWSVNDVAREAGMNWHTARDALNGTRASLTAFERVASVLGYTVYLEVEPEGGETWH